MRIRRAGRILHRDQAQRIAAVSAFIQSSMQDGTKPEEIGVLVGSAEGWPGFR